MFRAASLFCDRIGTDHPVIQAPMAQASTVDLATAVSNAGGLGSIPVALLGPDQIRKAIRDIRTATRRPFNVNIFVFRPDAPDPARMERAGHLIAEMERETGADAFDIAPLSPPPSWKDQLAVIVEERVPVFSFTFGVPESDDIEVLHRSGAFVMGTATSPDEAKRLEAVGVDAVVLQGSEAGGHRGTFLHPVDQGLVPLSTLVAEAASSVSLPVVASGGIMNGGDIAAALELGASAVQLGTAFLGCPETALLPAWLDALTGGGETVVTPTLTGRHARAIRNRFIDIMEPFENELPPFPYVAVLTARLRAWAAANGRPEYLPLLAGTGAARTRRLPAGELVSALVAEAREAQDA